MTAKYERDGIAFQYPENWSFEEEPRNGFPRTISRLPTPNLAGLAKVQNPKARKHSRERNIEEQYRRNIEDVAMSSSSKVTASSSHDQDRSASDLEEKNIASYKWLEGAKNFLQTLGRNYSNL